MDANSWILAALTAAVGFLIAHVFKKSDSETKTLREEVKDLAIALKGFETELKSIVSSAMSEKHAAPHQANPLQTILDGLTIVEKLKTIGLIQIGAAR